MIRGKAKYTPYAGYLCLYVDDTSGRELRVESFACANGLWYIWQKEHIRNGRIERTTHQKHSEIEQCFDNQK